MNWFHILPGFSRTPPGRERAILRRLPHWTWQGTLALAAPSLIARVWPWQGTASETYSRITAIDIGVISVVILFWTVALTVAIGAFIVMVMKGPAYVADAYPPAGTATRRNIPTRAMRQSGPASSASGSTP